MRLLPLLSLLLIALAPLLGFGCSTSSDGARNDEGAHRMIGRPPAPDEDDPFFVRALPANATPVEARGQITTTSSDIESVNEEPELKPSPHGAPEITATTAELEAPLPDVEEDISSHRHPRSACFSCVRICPLDSSSTPQCSTHDDDLICGWGTNIDPLLARRHAQANCDATLDLARQMPTYSEISGGCPPASCR